VYSLEVTVTFINVLAVILFYRHGSTKEEQNLLKKYYENRKTVRTKRVDEDFEMQIFVRLSL